MVSQRTEIQSIVGNSKSSREKTFVMQSDDLKGKLRQLRNENSHNSHFLSDMNGGDKNKSFIYKVAVRSAWSLLL